MNYEKIGKFISNLRKEKGWTQEELAEKLLVDRSNLSKWERGIYIPNTEILLKLQDLFDISINEIIYGERKNKTNDERISLLPIEIMEEGNKKVKKVRQLLLITILIIILLAISFLSYYFINNYNSIKVYKVFGESDNFVIKDGIMIVSKEKSYIKLGTIVNLTEKDILKTRLYYKKNNKEYDIFNGGRDDTELLLINEFNYNELYKYNDIRYILKGLFLEVTLLNNEKHIINLYLKKDFANNSLLNEKNVLPISDNESNYNHKVIPNYIMDYFEYDATTGEYYRNTTNNNSKILEKYVSNVNLYFIIKSNDDYDEQFDYSIDDNVLIYTKFLDKNNIITFTYNVFDNRCEVGECDKELISKVKKEYLNNIIK